ncbi:MAG: hypothetical protein WD872_00370, partial [Pirellulaceae bacterium]
MAAKSTNWHKKNAGSDRGLHPFSWVFVFFVAIKIFASGEEIQRLYCGSRLSVFHLCFIRGFRSSLCDALGVDHL